MKALKLIIVSLFVIIIIILRIYRDILPVEPNNYIKMIRYLYFAEFK